MAFSVKKPLRLCALHLAGTCFTRFTILCQHNNFVMYPLKLPRCGVLCCVALRCVELRSVALCCVVLCCFVLQCAALCCAVLCCFVLCSKEKRDKGKHFKIPLSYALGICPLACSKDKALNHASIQQHGKCGVAPMPTVDTADANAHRGSNAAGGIARARCYSENVIGTLLFVARCTWGSVWANKSKNILWACRQACEEAPKFLVGCLHGGGLET